MSPWTVERDGAVSTVTFANPPRNFMRFADMTELEAIVEQVRHDDGCTVLLLRSSTPGHFVAHGDLEDLLARSTGEEVVGDPRSWRRTLLALAELPQVVVAAINGRAGGGGLELAMACDVRLAGPGASFTFPEAGLGLIPGGGGTQRMPRLLGPSRTLAMILSRDVMGVDEARTAGLVDVVLGGDFDAAASDWVQRAATLSSEVVRAAKAAVQAAARLPLAEGLELEGQQVAGLMQDPGTAPLLVEAISRYARIEPEETPMGKTIVCGVDGSETAGRAAQVAAELAGLMDATLHVVSAYQKMESSTYREGAYEFVSTTADEAETVARKAAITLEGTAPRVTIAAVMEKPAVALIQEAERLDADLIVVGNKRVQGPARVLGSIASAVAHHAPCDVYVAHTHPHSRQG